MAFSNTRNFSERRQQKSQSQDGMESHKFKKYETKKNNTVETPINEQIKNYYTKSLNKFGFKPNETDIIINAFFKINKKDIGDDDNDNNNDTDSDTESFVKAYTKKENKTDHKTGSKTETKTEIKKIDDFNRDDITNACIIFLTTLNKWYFKNNETIKDYEEVMPDDITKFREAISNCPNLFSIPKDSGMPEKFIDIFANLGIVPKHFNISLADVDIYIQAHIEGLHILGVSPDIIKYNPAITGLASDPSKRLFTICHNKLINLEERKQMLTSFIIGCSMVSKPPNKIEFLPGKFIDVISKVYPTIGSCVKAINSKKGTNVTECFDDWSKTKIGKTLLCNDEYRPSEETIKQVFSISWRVFTAVYNTMTNRNCFSQSHIGVSPDGKKHIFPFMPIDYIKHISHTFPAELFKSTVNEMTDHRFVSTSFMMSTIMTILVSSFTNPDKEVNKYVSWIDMAIEDYYAFIKPNKSETKEEKFERIGNANKALYEVIKYMNEIGDDSPIVSILTDEEKRLFEMFFDGLANLFPENKTKKKSEKFEKDNEKEKAREVSNKGTNQYFMSFPGLNDDEDSKQSNSKSQSQLDSAWENPLYGSA